MLKNLYPAYKAVIKKAISKADTSDEQTVCVGLIDHFENDFLYFNNIPGKEDDLQELRDDLQAKHEEIKHASC